MRVLVVFEYATLNGGERSMLAVFDALPRVPTGTAMVAVGRSSTPSAAHSGGTNPAETPPEPMRIEVVAVAPAEGPLGAALAQRRIPHIPLELRTEAGTRVARDIACERLLAAVESIRPDVVHANSLAMGRLTGAIADRLYVPSVTHLRDILGLSAAAVDDLNRNRQLVAVSHATRAFHVGQGLDPDRACVIYNGVDCNQFRLRPASGCLRRELGLPPDAFLIGTIGQIGLRKGQDVLAEAAAHAAARVPRAHYLLIGERHSSKGESIAFEKSVVRRFEDAGLENHLHCLGYREDVPELLNELDLLVHPAHQEPLGRVLLEASASGLPIIATNVGGTPEILTDGESARLVPPENGTRLAEAIIELARDASLRDRLGCAARRRVVERFPIRAAAERLLTLWKTTAFSSRGRA